MMISNIVGIWQSRPEDGIPDGELLRVYTFKENGAFICHTERTNQKVNTLEGQFKLDREQIRLTFGKKGFSSRITYYFEDDILYFKTEHAHLRLHRLRSSPQIP